MTLKEIFLKNDRSPVNLRAKRKAWSPGIWIDINRNNNLKVWPGITSGMQNTNTEESKLFVLEDAIADDWEIVERCGGCGQYR